MINQRNKITPKVFLVADMGFAIRIIYSIGNSNDCFIVHETSRYVSRLSSHQH